MDTFGNNLQSQIKQLCHCVYLGVGHTRHPTQLQPAKLSIHLFRAGIYNVQCELSMQNTVTRTKVPLKDIHRELLDLYNEENVTHCDSKYLRKHSLILK